MGKKLLAILCVVGVIITSLYIFSTNAPLPAYKSSTEPASSPYPNFIAASGVTEANTRNIEIGTTISGVISGVLVNINDIVKQGTPLFEIDNWDINEKIKVKKSELNVISAQETEARLSLSEANRLLKNSRELENNKVVSTDQMLSKAYNVKLAEAKLATVQNQIELVKSEISSLQAEWDQHVVLSPIEGTVLQINIKNGEYTQAGDKNKPVMVLGNITPMYLRVDIDEYDAWRFNKDAEATALLKGNADFKAKLTFIRKEPLIIPKVSLSGNIDEKIDTRVMQVIYSFDPETFPIYIGQRMDVYIKAEQ